MARVKTELAPAHSPGPGPSDSLLLGYIRRAFTTQKKKKTHRGAFCGSTPYQMTTIAAASRPGCRSVEIVFELRRVGVGQGCGVCRGNPPAVEDLIYEV